jgi:8-oxo-dGTP diphosphatase
MRSDHPHLSANQPDDLRLSRLLARAARLGVDLGATLDERGRARDIEGSTNEWCLSKTEPQRTADVLVERPVPTGREVLLIARANPPFVDIYALPGGLVDPGETFAVASDREMGEEVGLHVGMGGGWHARVLADVSSTEWDPRFVGVHVGATYYRVPQGLASHAGDDAKTASWVPLEHVATGRVPLAFIHAEWFARAYEDEPELAQRFALLADAASLRNRRLITAVNVVRLAKGAAPIALN